MQTKMEKKKVLMYNSSGNVVISKNIFIERWTDNPAIWIEAVPEDGYLRIIGEVSGCFFVIQSMSERYKHDAAHIHAASHYDVTGFIAVPSEMRPVSLLVLEVAKIVAPDTVPALRAVRQKFYEHKEAKEKEKRDQEERERKEEEENERIRLENVKTAYEAGGKIHFSDFQILCKQAGVWINPRTISAVNKTKNYRLDKSGAESATIPAKYRWPDGVSIARKKYNEVTGIIG